jgi:hypothetical protein
MLRIRRRELKAIIPSTAVFEFTIPLFRVEYLC